jgi:hypothetical protein
MWSTQEVKVSNHPTVHRMFGTFSEKALSAYETLVREQYAEKQKRVKSAQGTEAMDNYGVSDTNHEFLDADESYDADDYGECYDFTTCIRANGSLYGIADGKKCRKGSETKTQPKVRTANEKKQEGIRKRGERSVTKARAEKVLSELAKQGATAKKATVRREKEGKGNREEQVRRLAGKVFVEMDRLRQRAKKMKDGPHKDKVLGKINRLKDLRGRLLKEQQRLRDQAPKAQGEGFGPLPQWATEGRSLA